MITVASIALYGASVFFAAGLGATSVKYKDGTTPKSEAAIAVIFTVVPFVLAAILQVVA